MVDARGISDGDLPARGCGCGCSCDLALLEAEKSFTYFRLPRSSLSRAYWPDSSGLADFSLC